MSIPQTYGKARLKNLVEYIMASLPQPTITLIASVLYVHTTNIYLSSMMCHRARLKSGVDFRSDSCSGESDPTNANSNSELSCVPESGLIFEVVRVDGPCLFLQCNAVHKAIINLNPCLHYLENWKDLKVHRLQIVRRAFSTKQRSFPTYQTEMSHELLSKRFGDETINFFAGSTLNRFSFKRQDNAFLSKCVLLSSARFLTFNQLDPLATKEGKLVLLKLEDIQSIIGNPYALTDEEKIAQWSAIDDATTVVFLGLDESKPTEQGGEPFFAVDVTPKHDEASKEKQKFIDKVLADGMEFKNVRVGVKLEMHESAFVAMGRSFIDWNARYQYCSGCGGKTISVWAGAKRQCPDKDRVSGTRQTCVSRKGLHNYQYPRTDTTVIMGILSSDGTKLLLGRQKVWPQGMYSCLAGFLEPGESLEEAVRRETWEESGIEVGRVQYHSSQPWPFPANLMIGCIGQALPGSTIDLGNDPELEDARWFTREELSHAGTMGIESHDEKPPQYSTPPEMAIAKKLINCFIRDDWDLDKLL